MDGTVIEGTASWMIVPDLNDSKCQKYPAPLLSPGRLTASRIDDQGHAIRSRFALCQNHGGHASVRATPAASAAARRPIGTDYTPLAVSIAVLAWASAATPSAFSPFVIATPCPLLIAIPSRSSARFPSARQRRSHHRENPCGARTNH